jgi:1-acyl-sn-glycerol-3-phosphate acyltransferase
MLGYYRLVGFAFLTFIAVSKMFVMAILKGREVERSIRYRRKLAQRLIKFLKIRCELRGKIPSSGTLCVTNHRSYIDSVCIFQFFDACPVVKAEVRKWPLIGFGLSISGTVFVNRSSQASRKWTRDQIAGFIRKQISTVVFVEGTTHVGPETLEFRPGTFMTAAEGGFSVVPIAIEFEHSDLAWVGEATFVPHFLRVFSKYEEIHVKVAFGEPIVSDDWEELREACHTWINKELTYMRSEFDGDEHETKGIENAIAE